jgi:hypothetical protein
MTSTRSDGINTLLYFFVPVQIMSVYGALTERMEYSLLFLLNIFVIMAHLHYAICVVINANDVPTGSHSLSFFRFDKFVTIWTSTPSRLRTVQNSRRLRRCTSSIDKNLSFQLSLLSRCCHFYVQSLPHFLPLSLCRWKSTNEVFVQ